MNKDNPYVFKRIILFLRSRISHMILQRVIKRFYSKDNPYVFKRILKAFWHGPTKVGKMLSTSEALAGVPRMSEKTYKISHSHAFTLIELLIVIAIIAILGSATVLVLNPVEIMKNGRDSVRMSDFEGLHKSLNLYSLQNSAFPLVSANTVYLSLPDSSLTCSSYSLPPLLAGWSYHCVTQSNLNKIDGNGWLPADLTSSDSKISVLPIDPVNDVATGKYYTFFVDSTGWELTSIFESLKYKPVSANDGGESTDIFERGTKLGITPRVENYIGNGNFTSCQGATNESGSVPTNTVIPMINPGSSECVVQQNGAGTEYEVHFKPGTQIEANTAYCLSLWVGYSSGFNGSDQVLHSRWYDGVGTGFTTSGAGSLFETKSVGGINWEKRYLTFTTPSTVNGGFNWYVGYPTSNTVGYRYITDLAVTKTAGTSCPPVFTDRQ